MPNDTPAGSSARSHLGDLLQSAYDLKQAADLRAEQWRRALFEVASRLCANKTDLERRLAETVEADALAQLIISEVADRLDELEWYRVNAGINQSPMPIKAADQPNEPSLQHDLEVLQQEAETLKAAIHTYEIQVQQLTAANAQLQQQIDDLRLLKTTPVTVEQASLIAGDAPAIDEALWPEWMKLWSAEAGFEAEKLFLRLVGRSLDCRRPRLIELFAQHRGIRADGGAVNELPRRLGERSPALLEIHKPKAGTGLPGRAPDLLSLTENGCDAFRLLFGEQPRQVYQEYLRRHKSAAQIALVLSAVDVLEAAGYVVDRFPEMMALPDGRTYPPDLSATRDGRSIAVEVEVGGSEYRNDRARDQKWLNVAEATGGKIHIVTPDRDTMLRLQSEIISWSMDHPQIRLDLKLTNIAELMRQPAPIAPGSDIWLRKR